MALKRIAFGAAALSIARAVQTVLAFLTLPLLARLLGPADYGLVALAMSFVLFTMTLSDAGLGQSLVRTPPEETAVWSSAFWMIGLLSAGLTVVLIAMAWPAAWLFNEPRLAPLVFALAPLPMIQGMLAPALADLQQREKFGLLALAEILGAAAGIFVAIAIAFSGGGAWALAAQQLAYWIGKAMIIACVTRFRPRIVLQTAGLASHFRFGRDMAMWGLVNFFARQIDPLVIAKFIGAAALGLYGMAYRLMTLPGHLVSGPVQNALYTRMVALRDHPASLKSLVLIATRALASFVLPPIAVLAVASSAFISVFLSERWLPAASLFAVLAPVGAIQAIAGLNGPLLMAIGRTDLRLKLTYEFTVLWVIAAPFLAMRSVMAVATGFSVIFLLYLPRTLYLFLHPIGATMREYIGAISIPLAIACGLAATHAVIKAVFLLPPWPEVGVAVCEILIGYGLTAYALRMRLSADLNLARNLVRPSAHATAMPDSAVLQK